MSCWLALNFASFPEIVTTVSHLEDVDEDVVRQVLELRVRELPDPVALVLRPTVHVCVGLTKNLVFKNHFLRVAICRKPIILSVIQNLIIALFTIMEMTN